MRRFFTIMVVALGLSLVLASCGGGSGSASTTIKVELSDFAFKPTEFTVPAGGQVTLEARNTGAVEHEFVIMKKGYTIVTPFGDKDEANIYWELEGIEAGQTKTGTFTAPTEPGEYQVVCALPGHIEAGMVAKLIVK